MLGPVMICIRCFGPSRVSLAMKAPPVVSASRLSTTGWRPCVISMPGSFMNCGRHQARVNDRSASAHRTSSEAKARASRDSGGTNSCNWSISCSYRNFSRASPRSCADNALSSNALSSGVMKRSAFFSVWRRR